MRASLTSRQLEVLCAVIECGGFAAAGRSLSISQAAISKQVHAVEQKIGFRVFVHRPGGVPRLTARGKALVQQLPELTQQLKSIAEPRRAEYPVQRIVRVGCGDAIAEQIAMNVSRLYEQIPGVMLEVRTLDPSVSSAFRLQDQDIDLAYFTLRSVPSDRMGDVIGTIHGRLYAPGHFPPTLGLTAAHPLPIISAPENSALSQYFEQDLKLLGIRSHQVVARFAMHKDRLRLALDGVGATFAVEDYAQEYVAAGRLQIMGPPHVLHRIRFVSPRRQLHPTIRRVEEFLTQLLSRTSAANR